MASTSISMATFSMKSSCFCNYNYTLLNNTTITTATSSARSFSFRLLPRKTVLEHVFRPISALGSGLETTLTEPKDTVITLMNVKVAVGSIEEDKIQLRVDLYGDDTESVFGNVLNKFGSLCPSNSWV